MHDAEKIYRWWIEMKEKDKVSSFFSGEIVPSVTFSVFSEGEWWWKSDEYRWIFGTVVAVKNLRFCCVLFLWSFSVIPFSVALVEFYMRSDFNVIPEKYFIWLYNLQILFYLIRFDLCDKFWLCLWSILKWMSFNLGFGIDTVMISLGEFGRVLEIFFTWVFLFGYFWIYLWTKIFVICK